MEISASLVKNLREKTGVSMMECKKALIATNGDFEMAIKHLRERGISTQAKKADREIKEGQIFTIVQADNKKGAILEINCETDFVAKNEMFKDLGLKLTKLILETPSLSTIENLSESTIDNTLVKEQIAALTLKLGENIMIRRFETINTNGTIMNYTHSNGKIGVLVALDKEIDLLLAKDIAMHIAASHPQYLSRAEVSNDAIEKEKEILKNQCLNEGKPAAVVDKIVDGRIGKYYQDVVLLEQPFVKDPKKTIKDLLPAGIAITQFLRYSF